MVQFKKITGNLKFYMSFSVRQYDLLVAVQVRMRGRIEEPGGLETSEEPLEYMRRCSCRPVDDR